MKLEWQQWEGDATSQTEESGHTEPMTQNEASDHSGPMSKSEPDNKDKEEVNSQAQPGLTEEHFKEAQEE